MFTRIRSFSNRGLPSSPRKSQPVDFSFRLDEPLAPPPHDSLEKEELRSASFDPDPIELGDDNTLRSYLDPLSKSPLLSPKPGTGMSSTQSNQIGTRHKSLDDSPIGEIEFATTSKALGDVKGLKVLDLACGTGRWSRWCVEHGAERVVGVDSSEAMIDEAKVMLVDLDGKLQKKLEFKVGDCSQSLGLEGEASFDLVLGAYSLSYAPNHTTQVAMFRNIRNDLKPGGRFVGVVPNAFCPMYEAYEYYGVRMEPLEEVASGTWRCKFQYKPDNVVVETYSREHGLIEKAAKEAGMGSVRWIPYVLPRGVGDQREDNGYWDEWKLRPHSVVLECLKPGGFA